MTPSAQVGHVIDLRVAFGRHWRAQCVVCKRFIKQQRDLVRCESCGTLYRHVEHSSYEVREAPDA